MNNKQVAHLWANKSRASAKGSSFYFEGDTIYSYGSHFPIARHYNGVILFTSKSYSVSTSKHIGITRGACHHLDKFTVSDVLRKPCREDVQEFKNEIQAMSVRASRARNVQTHLELIQRKIEEANKFCEHFGFKTRFVMTDNFEELKAKAKLSAERERKQKAAKLAKLAKDAEKVVAEWLAGAFVSIPGHVERVYLRARVFQAIGVEHMEMETSKGATVPLVEAEKAFRFAVLKRAKGWKRNGETFQVGDFHLDAVNEFGVISGCHRITWEEIERFGKVQGWII